LALVGNEYGGSIALIDTAKVVDQIRDPAASRAARRSMRGVRLFRCR
jgi:hypothetical protein